MPPQVIQQQQQSLASEMTARDRLTSYIYEYLQQTGASKTAETFKEEVLSTNPAAGLAAANSTKLSDKSFLLEWWLLFWDLYSAAPERRDTGGDPFSAEAKYFHEAMIGMPPGMNGHFAPPPMGMEMMGGHPGAFGGRFGPGRMPPGAMAPGGMPPGAFPMFPPDPRLQRMAPNQGMRMPPPPVGQPFPGAVGIPRPGGPGGAPMDMSGMQRFDFMSGPPPGGGAQPFPGASGSGGMMPNGAHPHMSLNSPSMGVPPPADMPSFMGMPPMPPTSSSAMPFGMSSDHQPMSAGPAAVSAPGATTAGGPGTPGMIGSVPGPGSVPQVATTSVGSVGTPSSIGGQQLHQPKQEITTNGEEMKTEALTPTGGGGGGGSVPPPPSATAAVSMNGGGGPGSAPGSAHSVNMNVNPGTPGSNPLSNPMSNPPLSSGPPPGSNDAFGKDDNGEISKIREGLLDGFCA